MGKCNRCGQRTKSGESTCWDCQWAHKKVGAEPTARTNENSFYSAQSSDASSKFGEANKKLKSNVIKITVAAVLMLGLGGAFIQAVNSQDLSTGTAESGQEQETQSQAPVQMDAVYFGDATVPLFTGRTFESAVRMLDESFGENFDEILNLDSSEKMRTSYSSRGEFRETEGLYVCSQSIAPGADPDENAFSRIEIEVSTSCRDSEVLFAMGPAAQLLGRFVPAAFGGECSYSGSCDLPEIDGVIIEFVDDGFRGHKKAKIQTGLGVIEAELALIDLASEWCYPRDYGDSDFRSAAIAKRDELLPPGTLVRLIGAKQLFGDERIFHRISLTDGFVDGLPPINSVNELLVASGYWVPDDIAGSHAWEELSYFDEDQVGAVWTESTTRATEPDIAQYKARIIATANGSFETPAASLSSCLEEKNEQFLVLLSEEEEEEEERRRVITARKNAADQRASDIEAVWRSVFCSDGGAEDFPERCASYNPAKDDKVGVGGGSGGGTNCTWVNAYTRKDGTRVSGHTRCR